MANQFHLDPVMVAEELDEFRWAFRVAAYNVIQADAKEAQARANQR